MTTPYVTGTVSVTAGSAIVTGAGTGWQTAGLVAGVFGLDSANGNPIPVLSVDSDTQITLAKPWRGTTASGQAYWITYDTTAGQQTVSNAQRLAEYIARLDKPALAALASLVPAADKLPYFGAGGAGALADFPAAARALLAGTGILPNAQLPTRLRSLVTPVADLNTINETGWSGAFDTSTNVPIAGFYLVHTEVWVDGTYAVQFAYSLFNTEAAFRRHKVNGVWQPWRAAGQVAVGTVSQSSGLPLGAIIERGSNANGEYTRFADGTQICTRSVATGNPTLAAGEAISLGSFNYAASFVASPSRTLSYDGSWSHTLSVGSEGGGNVGVGGLAISNRDNAAHTYAGTVYITAVGRWF